MDWLKALVLLLGLVNRIARYVEQKQQLDAGRAQQIADSLKASSELRERMLQAAAAERQRIQRDGLQLDQPDPDRRD